MEGRGQAMETRTGSRAHSPSSVLPLAMPSGLLVTLPPLGHYLLSTPHLARLGASSAIARVGEQECWPWACSPTEASPRLLWPLLWGSKGPGPWLPSLAPSVKAQRGFSVLEGSTVGTPTGGRPHFSA